jgi:hypothetical protein
MGPESNDICMCYIRTLINNAHEEKAFTKCSQNIITMQISTATPILICLFVHSLYKKEDALKFLVSYKPLDESFPKNEL